jgi:hypothetical protein
VRRELRKAVLDVEISTSDSDILNRGSSVGDKS